jgi:threonine dehydratase
MTLSADEIEAARGRLRGVAVRTPLIALPGIDGRRISLKLETLQPVGSFKIRGAGSAIGAAPRDQLARGVYTASAGNMAQGVAWCARTLGVPCTVIVPEQAPVAKTAPLTASLLAGHPVTVERTATFVDGIGAASLMAEMWPLVSTVIGGSAVSSLADVAGAVRYLAERAHVVAEGAGAAGVAAAMSGAVTGDHVVCVVSGGNIDVGPLVTILQGGVPG